MFRLRRVARKSCKPHKFVLFLLQRLKLAARKYLG
jgi:hypothetical protein